MMESTTTAAKKILCSSNAQSINKKLEKSSISRSSSLDKIHKTRCLCSKRPQRSLTIWNVPNSCLANLRTNKG